MEHEEFEKEIIRQMKESERKREELLNQIIPVKLVIALEGFRSERDRIVITEGLEINRAKPEMREEFFKRAKSLDLEIYNSESCEFFLTYHYQEQRRHAGTGESSERIFLISIFFAVCLDVFIKIDKAQSFISFRGEFESLGIRRIHYRSMKYERNVQFDDGHFERLKRFWPLFTKQFNEMPHYALVARRYHYSLSRLQWEDEIIDLTIALEALLMIEQTKNIGSKIAKRLSKLLWATYDRGKITEVAIECYELRNKVVHGEVVNEKYDKIRSLIEMISICVKQALQLYLTKYHMLPASEFIKQVDSIPRKKN